MESALDVAPERAVQALSEHRRQDLISPKGEAFLQIPSESRVIGRILVLMNCLRDGSVKLLPSIYLAARGWNVLVASRTLGSLPDALKKPERLQFRALDGTVAGQQRRSFTRKLRDLVRLSLFCRTLLAERDYDLFYVHDSMAVPMAMLALWRKRRQPVVYHTHEYLEPGRLRLRRLLERRFARKADLVISNEPNRGRFLMSDYQLRSMPLILPIFWNRDFPAPAWSAEKRMSFLGDVSGPNAKLLVYQGALGPERCILEMITAMSHLPQAYRLLVFGGTNKRSYVNACTNQVKNLKLEKRVSLMGRLPRHRVLEATAVADCGIFLCRNDAIGHYYCAPTKLTEYVACGVPVVGPAYSGVEALVYKFDLGACCNPEDPRDIARAIANVCDIRTEGRSDRRKKLEEVFRKYLCFESVAERLHSSLMSLR